MTRRASPSLPAYHASQSEPGGGRDTLVKPASPLFLREEELRRGLDLLQLGHSRLARAADAPLAAAGLGRAHHRALTVIGRCPDVTVSRLVALLGITKQSLGRVLADLTAKRLVEAREGMADRRQKRLRLTAAGKALEQALFDAVRGPLAAAYAASGQQDVTGFWRVLEGLVPADEAPLVAALLGDAAGA